MKIKHLIFDFGDVFLTLDKSATNKYLSRFGLKEFTPEMLKQNEAYEQGLISTEDFVSFYTSTVDGLTAEKFIEAWNSILIDFPEHRLQFIQQLAEQANFDLVLLSNTNELHIDWIKQHINCFESFKSCFSQFYLSHEIKLRKPNPEIFEFVINQNKFKANHCLFIDDTKEHTLGAHSLGIKTWHLKAGQEDVTDLFTKQAHLF
ncbi:HAD-IA family hydrolase [Psychroflexus sp. ALD_RP9]|uniref:HAD-IA family hydrolase n=1 Tax=Psychroflexus sp. ALD_RP9 TaxID=2777186 RepID=UPI001A909F2C|nr:HAD-IA family hydrolase [Psychroflexus sp. ALD_RP9]QSS97138.1 HAD-IA family hydrolase [Psychroflexus sp. ALD_RP9]